MEVDGGDGPADDGAPAVQAEQEPGDPGEAHVAHGEAQPGDVDAADHVGCRVKVCRKSQSQRSASGSPVRRLRTPVPLISCAKSSSGVGSGPAVTSIGARFWGISPVMRSGSG